ncbi:MAG: hypothetical protein ACLTDR_00720 [Adlercreutzia equolifaciens]
MGSRLLWVLALLVQATLVLYCALFGAGIHVPEPVNWVCGAIFGVYLPVAMTSWFAVHIDRRSFSVIWNIVLAGVFASFVIWVFSGLEAVKLCVCMGAHVRWGRSCSLASCARSRPRRRTTRLCPRLCPRPCRRMPSATRPRRRFCSASPSSRPSPLPVSGRQRFLCFGGFLRSDAAHLRRGALGKCGGPPADDHRCARYHRGRHSRLPIFTSEPALSFDLAALGMFLFLAYAVVLLCASAQGTRRHTLAAFTGLMVATSPPDASSAAWGMALCFALVEQFASNIMVLLSILAANAAMIILVRRGVTPIRSAELSRASRRREISMRPVAPKWIAWPPACGLGEREGGAHAALRGCSASEVASAMVSGQRHGEVAHPPRLQEARRPAAATNSSRNSASREKRKKGREEKSAQSQKSRAQVAEGVPRAVH